MKPFLPFIACLLPFMSSANNPQGIADGNTRFAFKLFNQVQGSTKSENQFYSPFSISTALAMVYAGARNETALQMSHAMNFQPNDHFHAEYKHLLDKLPEGADGKIKLNIANGIWVQKEFKVLDTYFDVVRSKYNSELKNVDFTNNTARETSRMDINAWVERKTNDKIKNIIKQGDLTALTRLVLVNAIYFHGDWATPFKKELTKAKGFSLVEGTKDRVPFMNRQGRYNYFEDGKIQAIEIPYQDNKASLVILLPLTVKGISEFGKSFDYQYYQDMIESLQFDEVRLSLPKFKIDFHLELGSTLSQMGMPLAFSPDGADFSGMTGKRDLFISKVIHQAFIKVDETGTEAAAATAVVMDLAMAPQTSQPKVFNADHPFVFLIKDNLTGSILFMGTIMKPGVSK